MDENKDSDIGFEELVNAWPRLKWWQRKHIRLLVFYYVQSQRLKKTCLMV